MTAKSGEGIKADERNFGSVRTGNDNFRDNRSEKAATERTGGETILTYNSNQHSSLFANYRRNIYPLIKDYRGSTRLLNILKNQAYCKLEDVSEQAKEISEFDWNNLIVLDGCRYDLYNEVRSESGYRVSKGTHSKEFIESNFSTGDCSDTIYITSNPFFSEDSFEELIGEMPENVFYEVFHTYRTDWNSEEGTVLPDPVIRDAKTAEKLYPDKRKIIHFMQPHYPFVPAQLADGFSRDSAPEKESVWDLAEAGEISQEKVWNGYKENLEYVLNKIESNLLSELSGKVLLTSDHGNLVGEAGLYGHSFSGDVSSSKSLRKVPVQVLRE